LKQKKLFSYNYKLYRKKKIDEINNTSMLKTIFKPAKLHINIKKNKNFDERIKIVDE